MRDDDQMAESSYWRRWRIRWIPRAVTFVVAVVLAWLADAGYQRIADVLHPAQPAPTMVVDSLLINNAGVMSEVCHAWLRHDRTRRDSLDSYNYAHTDPESKLVMSCMQWMVLAGERP